MHLIARDIRAGKLDLGRKHYALSLSMGVLSAIFCNVGKIVAVEFGVGAGQGLLDLCKAAEFFIRELDFEIEVYGLDNATGLPEPAGYRDLPELWKRGEFLMRNPDLLRAKLPAFAHLVIGDVAETTRMFGDILSAESPLGFVAVDVDYYSSTKPCLEIFRHDALCYLPAVPMHFDDLMIAHLTYNSWCGETLAINEFNQQSAFRKIEANPLFKTMHPLQAFHACHVLDHPVRTGQTLLRDEFSLIHLKFY